MSERSEEKRKAKKLTAAPCTDSEYIEDNRKRPGLLLMKPGTLFLIINL